MSTRIPLFILFIGVTFLAVSTSSAKFTSSVAVSHNTVLSGSWAPTPSPTPAVPPVVINEVMWMGSSESSLDEWIELRNATDEPVDVGQWTIDNARASNQPALMIPASHTIPANGYLLIARYSSTNANSALAVSPDVVANISLADNGNGHLILKDKNGNVVDRAKGDVWPAGIHGGTGGVRQSMQRVSPAADGLLGSSWQTCVAAACQSDAFWDVAAGLDYGTPKSANVID